MLYSSGGSVFLFDRKVLRYFRKDGHNWRKKKDGKTVKEAHEKLKVGVDSLGISTVCLGWLDESNFCELKLVNFFIYFILFVDEILLQVGSIDVLHCYYAHGEEDDNFQRRSYWMLEQ